LAAFVQAACTQQRRDPRHVIAVGFSNGANIAAAMLLKRPEILEAAVLIRAMVPFEPPSLPRLPGTPVLMLSARNDPIVSPTNTLRLADLLKSAGAALSLQWNAGGHGLSGDDVDSARRWLAPLLAVETPQKVSMDRGRT
jgi:predicted esterase